MTTENKDPAPEIIQLTAEETEEIAMELGHVLIMTTHRFCHEIGLNLSNSNTRELIRATFVALAKSVPGAPTPTAQG